MTTTALETERPQRKPDLASIAVGEALPPIRWEADMADVEAFGQVLYPDRPGHSSRATNPHLNEAYASQHIYGGLTVDGNQTVDYLCRLVTRFLPPGALLSGHSAIEIKFPNPCRVGDVVEFTGTVVGKANENGRDMVAIDVLAENQAGKVVAAGRISAYVPAPGDGGRP